MFKFNLLGITRRSLCVISITALLCFKLYGEGLTVTFPSRTITIEEAFGQIESQTGYLISYTHGNFETNSRIHLTGKSITLPDALDQLLAKTDRTYIFSNNNILIVPRINRKLPVYIPETTPEEREQVIIKPELFFLEETSPDISLVDLPELPFNNPTLDGKISYSQRVNRGKNGVPRYVENQPVYAIKTNLLYAGLAYAPNIGIEVGITPRSTIDMAGGFNRWKLKGTDTDNRKKTHWLVSAEYRYWLCERFNGHFVGAHALFGYYNIAQHNMPLLFEKKSDNYRYKGNAYGVGISYGYQLMLGERWNLEINAGVGVAKMHYDKWACPRCGDIIEKGKNRIYLGPTRGGITISYILK